MSEGKILIVEDDEDIVHLLEVNLRKRGYTTLSTLEGLGACYLIEEEKPDLILLDIMLPGLSGFEICEIVRRNDNESISSIPIIMLTALSSTENKLKGIEMGADDYIPKPFVLKEVMLKVERMIDKEKKKKQLNRKIRNLEAKERRHMDFQGMLFHELRNQLLIIGGYSSIAQRRCLSPDKQRYYAGVIKESSLFLNSLAEEVLLLYRMQTGEQPLPMEDVCPEKIIEQVISLLSPQANDKKIQVHFQRIGKIPKMRLNSTALKLCLLNLIGNAVKYSPQKSKVKLNLRLRGKSEVILEVKDSGPGIPKEYMGRIFERFYRGEDVKNKTKGTGLGLYVAKTLIEAMGGALEVKCCQGNGCIFSVMLRGLHETGN